MKNSGTGRILWMGAMGVIGLVLLQVTGCSEIRWNSNSKSKPDLLVESPSEVVEESEPVATEEKNRQEITQEQVNDYLDKLKRQSGALMEKIMKQLDYRGVKNRKVMLYSDSASVDTCTVRKVLGWFIEEAFIRHVEHFIMIGKEIGGTEEPRMDIVDQDDYKVIDAILKGYKKLSTGGRDVITDPEMPDMVLKVSANQVPDSDPDSDLFVVELEMVTRTGVKISMEQITLQFPKWLVGKYREKCSATAKLVEASFFSVGKGYYKIRATISGWKPSSRLALLGRNSVRFFPVYPEESGKQNCGRSNSDLKPDHRNTMEIPDDKNVENLHGTRFVLYLIDGNDAGGLRRVDREIQQRFPVYCFKNQQVKPNEPSAFDRWSTDNNYRVESNRVESRSLPF